MSIGGRRLNIVLRHGDITALRVDCIVNAANSWLGHGGGLAAAIRIAGGRPLVEESDAWIKRHGGIAEGSVGLTVGGALPCTWVLHAVGPVYRQGLEAHLLSRAFHNSLVLADRLECRSVAMPLLSSGIFAYPKDDAATITILNTYYRKSFV
jgi:O-acetyl-ADP-ribose deacetylase